MDMDKICTILLLLALMVIICRNSSELGIEGLENDQKKEALLEKIDEDAEEAIDMVDEVIDGAVKEVAEVADDVAIPPTEILNQVSETVEDVVQPDEPPAPEPPAPEPVPEPTLPETPPEPTPPPPPAVEPTPTPPQPKQLQPNQAPPPPQQPPQPPQQVKQPQQRPDKMMGSPLLNLNQQGPIMAYDGSFSTFAGAGAHYGERIPLSMQQEYATLKSLGKVTPQMMQNIERAAAPPLQDSQVPRFDPTSSGGLLPNQFPTQPSPGGAPQMAQQQQAPSNKELEVHFVFAGWCGHSQRAIPDFKQLVSDTSVVTSTGIPVKFIMTEEQDPGMAQFKGKVQGFPTYMGVMKENGNVVDMKELPVSDRSAQSIKAMVSKM